MLSFSLATSSDDGQSSDSSIRNDGITEFSNGGFSGSCTRVTVNSLRLLATCLTGALFFSLRVVGPVIFPSRSVLAVSSAVFVWMPV